jgi:hypothetical protein
MNPGSSEPMAAVRTIAEQAGVARRVVDLTAAPWQKDPPLAERRQAKARAECCPGCGGFDRWVATLGGFAGERYIALCNEAREMAGPDGQQRYLEMARAIDEEHAASPGKWLAAIELGNAEREREAGHAARQAADAAAAACLQRATDIQLAVQHMGERLAPEPDFSTGPSLSSAEVTHGLMAAMGLADPRPRRHDEALRPIGDLARQIGIRP